MNSELYDRLVQAQSEFNAKAMAILGVHATSIGMKTVADEATPTLAIVGHVDKKKALVDIPESERIPAQLAGLPTDVVENGAPYPLVGPLQGGADLRVGNFAGTLGCLVRDQSDTKTCLLSNQHVLDNVGTTLYVQKNDACHKVGYTKRTALNSTVDAAIASINDGIDTSATIAEIGNVAGSRAVTWQDMGKTVRKMGRTTGLRYGYISGLNYQGTTSLGGPTQNQVTIDPVTAKNKEFAAPGDSGSVIVDENNFVVAHLWPMPKPSPASLKRSAWTIPAMLDGENTVSVLAQLRAAVAGYVNDSEFIEQMDAAYADVSSHIGGSWRDALSDQPAEAGVTAVRTD